MSAANPLRITPKLVVGIGVLLLGLLWTLDNFDALEVDRIIEWWPLIVVGAGVARLFDRRSSRIGSVVIIVVGVLLLGDTLDYIDIDLGDIIPVIVAGLGAKLIWDALGYRQARISTADPFSTINAVGIMAGIHRQNASVDFLGGNATAIMGGVEIDLRNAKIADGQRAVIDTFAFWGGIDIKVPRNWRVDDQVFPLMGGCEDKTETRRDDVGTGPVLVITGVAFMGGIEVSN